MNTVLSFALVLALAPTLVEDRPAETIRAELEALTLPVYDEEQMLTEGYGDAWRAACREVRAQRAPLILELWTAHPDHEGLGELLAERWEYLLRIDDELVASETEAVLELAESSEDEAVTTTPSESVLEWAAHYRTAAALSIHGAEGNRAAMKEAIERLVELATGTSEMRSDLIHLCLEFVPDYSLHESLYDRLAQGASLEVVEQVGRMAKATKSLHMPFGWSFDNALKKGRYDFRKQKGKVLVVEFWKSDQRESLERIPMLRRLRETYPDLELVGVSLDHRSDLRRKEFRVLCEELGVDWPQFFQGDGIDSFYSNGWGVYRTPRTFVVGTDGLVRRLWVGDDLEQIVADLHP